MIINTQHYQSKIIFPDYKFDLNLNLANKDYTIKNLLEDSRRSYERDNILSIAFLDQQGNQIANSTKASMLLRLDKFIININWGDRIYNCINSNYLGNNRLERELVTDESGIDYDKMNNLVFNSNLPFSAALEFSTSEEIPTKKVKYSSILKDYLRSKYSVINRYHESIQESKERRIQKILNSFFYASLIQVVTLNLCTFVFFSWDFMEPITQCMTYINIVCGYYYWAITQENYEMEAMIYWMRNIRPRFRSSVINQMLQEEEEIKSILEDDRFKH